MADLPDTPRGDNIKFDVTVTQGPGGPALDLTLYSIWCTGKRQMSDLDVDAIWQVTKAGGDITVTGTGNNIARVNVPGTFTAVLTDSAQLFYDVQIKSPANDIDTVANGRIKIILDVTRAT